MSKEMKKIIYTLSTLERKVLNIFKEHNKDCIAVEEIEKKAKDKQLTRNVILRVSLWLQRKNLVEEKRTQGKVYTLTEKGIMAIEKGLPEKKLFHFIKTHPNTTIAEAQKKSQLSKEEFSVALGFLKKNAVIKIVKGVLLIEEKLKKDLFPHEVLLNEIYKKKILSESQITQEQRNTLKLLQRRGLITTKQEITITLCLTKAGRELLPLLSEVELIEALTPDIITSKKWKTTPFRSYNVSDPVPPRIPGKRHYVNQVIEYIRRIWIELGFEEMYGNVVESAYWCFDALYVPQDHPAREMQDTFFLKQPKKAKIPKDYKKVKTAHEKGVSQSWKSWGGTWSKSKAEETVLRTHTTVLSARTLARIAEEGKIPGKFFSVGICFRNEKVDWSHLAEFRQVEGIVVDPDVTFTHLIGYLKIFFEKLGFKEIRFRPAYFPYTEPSLEIEVFHPVKKKWLELGGAGVFRPEVTEPLLGTDIPVLAWGPGLDRIVMDRYNINDIRTLNANDLSFLRKTELWLK